MVFFLLFPVAIGLLIAGAAGFIYVRKALLGQWEEAALLKLERAAHYIDMRLSFPIERIKLIGSAGNGMTRQRLLDEIKALPGVSEVRIEWRELPGATSMHKGGLSKHPMMRSKHPMMRFHNTRVSKVTQPVFDTDAGLRVVTILTSLLDNKNNEIGQLVVKLEFDYLMEDISKLGWWQSNMACLVTKSGKYLLHTNMIMDGRVMLGDNGASIEMKLLNVIPENDFGTVMGSGHPPDFVAGYHSLSKAPWTIILFAPGNKILGPIVRFQIFYFSGSLLLIFFTLFLIRVNVGKIVGPIQKLSKSASSVAGGNYGEPIVQESDDEIGQLIVSYNSMVQGLKERDFIRNTFGRYMDEDVARDLLKKPDAIRLGGDKREVVTLMSDIRGFTSVSETLDPEQTIRLLNNYFGHMIQVIKTHRGIIVDFVGDAVLVFFDPTGESIQSTAFRAACCAVEMQAEMERFNYEMKEKRLPQLKMGIGMNSGEVIVGNIGSASRVKYGIVGSPVNLTQRIQEKAQGNEIMISEHLLNNLKDTVIVEGCVEVNVKGVNNAMRLYSISGIQKHDGDMAELQNTCKRIDGAE